MDGTEDPMLTIRRSNDRGGGDYDWLKTHHTFSFNDYWDEKWMGFRSLRVINEDWVAPSSGFPTHPHRDMEIITYVLSASSSTKTVSAPAQSSSPVTVSA